MPPVNLGLLVIISAMDLLIQWAATYLFLMYKLGKAKDNSNSNATQNLPAKVFWSLILPTAFQVVSIFVLIWENSKSTRALGSLLVTCWQGLAISLVADYVVPGIGRATVLVGIVTLILWRMAVTQVAPQDTACVGFEVDLLFDRSNEGNYVPSLCLT